MENVDEAPLVFLKQLIKEKLLDTDGNLVLSEHPVIESRSKDLGLTERNLSKLIQDIDESINWDKERERDIDSAISPIIINDEKIYSVKKLGKILFENPEFASSYLRNDSILTGNVNYLTSQNGSKAATVGDIYNSEKESGKRYLKIIYHLNPQLPYRLIDSEIAETPSELAQLIFKNQRNYLTGKKQFDNGSINLWLQAKDKELSLKIETIRLRKKDDEFSFLESMYSLNNTLPFKFKGQEDISSPEELALKIDTDSTNWEVGKRAFLGGYIALWLNKTGKQQTLTAWENKRKALVIDKENNVNPDDILLEEFLQTLNPALPKPKLSIAPDKVEFLNITTKKIIKQEIVLKNTTRGYLEIKTSFSAVLPGVEGSPKVAVLSKFHSSDTQKLKVNINATSYKKGVVNQTSVDIKKSDGSIDKILVRFRVVFPILAYLVQLFIYGAVAALFFAGIRQMLAKLTGYTYWLSQDEKLTSYLPFNINLNTLDKFFYPFQWSFFAWCFAGILIILICIKKMKYFKWLILLTIATIIYAIANQNVFAIASVNSFLFTDKLLRVSDAFLPVPVWALLGFFLGTILGGIVACKKIHLPHKFWLFPIAGFALIFSVFFMITKPLNTYGTNKFYVNKTKSYAYNFTYPPSASSELPSSGRNNYSARNLIDYNPATAWIENSPSFGINQSIDFIFPFTQIKNYQEVDCRGFMIINGYSKSYKTYYDYNRVYTFTVAVNGIPKRNGIAKDSMNQRQEITFEPFKINANDRISVIINSVYFGKRKTDKTAISELIPMIEYY